MKNSLKSKFQELKVKKYFILILSITLLVSNCSDTSVNVPNEVVENEVISGSVTFHEKDENEIIADAAFDQQPNYFSSHTIIGILDSAREEFECLISYIDISQIETFKFSKQSDQWVIGAQINRIENDRNLSKTASYTKNIADIYKYTWYSGLIHSWQTNTVTKPGDYWTRYRYYSTDKPKSFKFLEGTDENNGKEWRVEWNKWEGGVNEDPDPEYTGALVWYYEPPEYSKDVWSSLIIYKYMNWNTNKWVEVELWPDFLRVNFHLYVVTPLSVSISGPTSIPSNQLNTFRAHVSGGSGTITNYKWWKRNDNSGGEEPLLKGISPRAPNVGRWYEMTDWEGQSEIQTRAGYDFSLKCRVYKGGSTAEDIHSVNVY
jgi:hypothetical protein